jgi:hypothetical protein
MSDDTTDALAKAVKVVESSLARHLVARVRERLGDPPPAGA